MDSWPWPGFSPELSHARKGIRIKSPQGQHEETVPLVPGPGHYGVPNSRTKATYLKWQPTVYQSTDVPTLGCPSVENKPQCGFLLHTTKSYHVRSCVFLLLKLFRVLSVACNQRTLRYAIPPSIIESRKSPCTLCPHLSPLCYLSIKTKILIEI